MMHHVFMYTYDLEESPRALAIECGCSDRLLITYSMATNYPEGESDLWLRDWVTNAPNDYTCYHVRANIHRQLDALPAAWDRGYLVTWDPYVYRPNRRGLLCGIARGPEIR